MEIYIWMIGIPNGGLGLNRGGNTVDSKLIYLRKVYLYWILDYSKI